MTDHRRKFSKVCQVCTEPFFGLAQQLICGSKPCTRMLRWQNRQIRAPSTLDFLTCVICGADFCGHRGKRTVKGCSPECRRVYKLAMLRAYSTTDEQRKRNRLRNTGERKKAGLERLRQYQRDFPERKIAYDKDWRQANPEKMRASARRSRRANPGAVAHLSARAHAKERKAKTIFDELAKINPSMYEAIDRTKSVGRQMWAALKFMNIEVSA